MSIVPAADVQLNRIFHVYDMNNFACVRTDRLQHDVVRFLAIHGLRGVILNNIEHLQTV